MMRNRSSLYRFLTVLGMVVLMSIAIPSRAGAQGIVRGSNLPAGETLTGDGIFHGKSVRIDGNVIGDVFAIANQVEINGRISGSLVVLGDKVTINSEVEGTVYVAAIQFDLKSNADLSRNLYFCGLSLSTHEESQIRRDLYSATLGAQLNGVVDGEIRAIIGPAEFFFLFMEKINQTDWFNSDNASKASIADQNHEIDLTTKATEILYASLIPDQFLKSFSLQQEGEIDWEQVAIWLLERLRDWLVLLVFGLLGLWLKPKWIPDSAQLLLSRPLAATGWGLVGLVISFNLIGVAVLILIIIIAIGLFLGMIPLWQLALSFMAISGFSLGLVSTIFTLIVIYISKAVVAFQIGAMILDRFAPSSARYHPLALIIGLVLYILLATVPVLGWVIGMLATVLGLGAVWLHYKDEQSQGKIAETKICDEVAMV